MRGFSARGTHAIPISKKTKSTQREGTAYVIINTANEILLYRRAERVSRGHA